MKDVYVWSQYFRGISVISIFPRGDKEILAKYLTQEELDCGAQIPIITKNGYNYPYYVETYEDKEKYELKCCVATLRVRYGLNGCVVDIDFFMSLCVNLSIYVKKLIIDDEEHAPFLDVIWQYVLKFIDKNKVISNDDITRINNEKYVTGGLFKYINYRINNKRFDGLKEVCLYLVNNNIVVSNKKTQFNDFLNIID